MNQVPQSVGVVIAVLDSENRLQILQQLRATLMSLTTWLTTWRRQ